MQVMAPEKTGWLQVCLLLLMALNYCMVSMNHALPTFHGYTPPFHCGQVDNTSIASPQACMASNSSMLDGSSSCPGGYRFDSPLEKKRLVSEWQLVCERRVLLPLAATLYFCGVTLGAVACGMLADRFGRRPVLLTCLFGQALLGVGIYFTNSLTLFMVLRVVQGFFMQGMQGATYTLLVELFPPRTRTAVGVTLELYWALGLAALAGCDYLVPDWRYLQLTLAAPTLLTLLYICMIPESPRWLSTQGRHEEAQRVWMKLVPAHQTALPQVESTTNKQAMIHSKETLPMTDVEQQKPDKPLEKCGENTRSESGISTDSLVHEEKQGGDIEDKMDNEGGENRNLEKEKKDSEVLFSNGKPPKVKLKTERSSILELIRRRVVRKHCFVMTYIWFSVSLSYYGVMFYLPALSGDRHLNFLWGALLEIAAYVIGFWVLARFGRRLPLCIYLLASGVVCVAVGGISIVPDGATEWNGTARTVLTLIGKTAIVSAFCVIFLYTSELFPTVLRAAALGLCGFWGRVGSLISPQLLLVGEYTSPAVPMVCMGALCLAAGGATLVLPETLGLALPDTIQQAQNLSRKDKTKT